MVEDSAIKAPKSPFAMRENEIKVFDGKDGYASIDRVVNKIDMGVINELHFQILEIINDFGFITSRQIYQLLKMRGEELKSQDKLNKKLEDIIKTKVITRYYFESSEGKGIYRVYCLDKNGKYLLQSIRKLLKQLLLKMAKSMRKLLERLLQFKLNKTSHQDLLQDVL